MMQIVLLIGAIPFFVVGFKALAGSGLSITTEKKLEGPRAKLVGAICIVVGVLILILAFVVLPMLVSDVIAERKTTPGACGGMGA